MLAHARAGALVALSRHATSDGANVCSSGHAQRSAKFLDNQPLNGAYLYIQLFWFNVIESSVQ
jgi:hypothetical protein